MKTIISVMAAPINNERSFTISHKRIHPSLAYSRLLLGCHGNPFPIVFAGFLNIKTLFNRTYKSDTWLRDL